jgi:acyl-CoA synthetase (AMP-forming)/AMP-acid ligase II
MHAVIKPAKALDSVGDIAWSARVLAGAGLLGPYRPDRVVGMGLAIHRYGLSVAGAYALNVARTPDRPAVIDEDGALTFVQMEDRTGALAAALAEMGIGEADRVAVVCRNHRGFVEATIALAKLGADTMYLNTGFAPPQLAATFEREGASAIILDDEFLPLAAAIRPNALRVVAWSDRGERSDGLPTIEGLLAGPVRSLPPRPRREGKQIILTSGTTGTPKGARRGGSNLEALISILSTIPLHTGDVVYDAAPLFHSWGLAHFALGLVLGNTLVLRRRFDPEAALRLIEEGRVNVLAAVPVMLQRIMDLPTATREQYDTSSLRVVAVSGSALPGDLALRFMDAFGDVLYNLYGSTEVAWASIATPSDLRQAPGTAGRPPRGTVVKLVDADGHEVAEGRPGRIFVANSMLFEGYTGGGSKPVVGGLMGTGDTGHFDDAGRLFVDGRDDDMIVSGGENVFPREVEDLLSEHPAVAECAVVGVADTEFGQRLKGFVVLREGHAATATELQDYVRARLARYKIPREVVFVSDLPRNATGKVVKRDLPP